MTKNKPLIPPGTAPRGIRGNTQGIGGFSLFGLPRRRPQEPPTSSKRTWKDVWLILGVSAMVITAAVVILSLFGHLF